MRAPDFCPARRQIVQMQYVACLRNKEGPGSLQALPNYGYIKSVLGCRPKNLWRNEDQQFCLALVIDFVPEQVPNPGQVAKERDLLHVLKCLELIDTTKHDSLSVVDENRRIDLTLGDLRERYTTAW